MAICAKAQKRLDEATKKEAPKWWMPQAPIATLDPSQTRSMAISGTYIEIPPIYKVHVKAI